MKSQLSPESSITDDMEDFFENAAVGLHFVSADGTILRANKAELDMLGYSPSEYIGRPISAFHANPEVIQEILGRLANGETLIQYPARLIAKDGSSRHVRITSSALFHSGKLIHTRCITIDVTSAVRADQRFHQVLEALPAAVYTTDASGRITYYNRAASDLAGRTPTIGVDEWCVTWRLYTKDGDFLPHDQCPMAIALKEQRPVRGMEAWAERPDGTRVPFIPFPTPLYDEAGRMTGAINMLVDIRERKKAEETQSLLIDELNHRVKNTLAIVQALAQQSLRHSGGTKEFVENFSGRLGALARAHTSLAQTAWRGTEFSALLRDQLLLGTDADGRIALVGPLVMLNAQQSLNLALVVHELATNARKYGALSTPSGKLSVNWTIEGNEERVLSLHWEEHNLPNVLEPASPGFGTVLIHQIASPEGGSAQMKCTANGIAWDIKFALFAAGDNPRTVSTSKETSRRKVLVVEDEVLIAMDLELALRSAGVDVEQAARLEEGLQKIQNSNFDAAILDVNLNGKRSDELAAALRSRKIPFAFSTGYGVESLPVAYQDVPLLMKPFGRSDVAEVLGNLLKKSTVVNLRVPKPDHPAR